MIEKLRKHGKLLYSKSRNSYSKSWNAHTKSWNSYSKAWNKEAMQSKTISDRNILVFCRHFLEISGGGLYILDI